VENKTNIETVLEHFKSELRLLIDNFGEEKHPEKIAAVSMAIQTIEKEIPKEPKPCGLADQYCPTCESWIAFDRLNGKVATAPKRCVECGQKLDWQKSQF
jgi:hypothetical protein